MTIICEDLCERCKVRFHKNPEILGDYDIGGTLMRHCPICGAMLPLLVSMERDENSISQSSKRLIGVRIARKNGLDYREVYEIIKNFREVSKEEEFIKKFQEKLKETFNLTENVKSFL